ncbi:MAG: diacylglycerol kinase family protein [Chthoniobacteraceae bacterium]
MTDIQNKQGIGCRYQARLRAFGYAFQGLRTLLFSQCHARFHALAAVLVIVLGFLLKISLIEWCLVSFAITLVFACEAINTAIEFLTDRVSMEPHPLSGKAKDVAAGAVLIASVGAAAIGVIIFGPKIWRLIF